MDFEYRKEIDMDNKQVMLKLYWGRLVHDHRSQLEVLYDILQKCAIRETAVQKALTEERESGKESPELLEQLNKSMTEYELAKLLLSDIAAGVNYCRIESNFAPTTA